MGCAWVSHCAWSVSLNSSFAHLEERPEGMHTPYPSLPNSHTTPTHRLLHIPLGQEGVCRGHACCCLLPCSVSILAPPSSFAPPLLSHGLPLCPSAFYILHITLSKEQTTCTPCTWHAWQRDGVPSLFPTQAFLPLLSSPSFSSDNMWQ